MQFFHFRSIIRLPQVKFCVGLPYCLSYLKIVLMACTFSLPLCSTSHRRPFVTHTITTSKELKLPKIKLNSKPHLGTKKIKYRNTEFGEDGCGFQNMRRRLCLQKFNFCCFNNRMHLLHLYDYGYRSIFVLGQLNYCDGMAFSPQKSIPLAPDRIVGCWRSGKTGEIRFVSSRYFKV